MSMTQILAPHLPFLRRYARALTGSQSSGDAYVRAALSALLSGEQALDADTPPRLALYRLFHAIWSTASGQIDDEEGGREPEGFDAEERLQALSATRRASLLLTAVEAFNLSDAAYILDETPEAEEKAIVDAQSIIDRQLDGSGESGHRTGPPGGGHGIEPGRSDHQGPSRAAGIDSGGRQSG